MKCNAIGDNKSTRNYLVGHSAIQGWRAAMEDRFVVEDLNLSKHSILAVFDGHAGTEGSQFCADNFIDIFHSTESWNQYKTFHKNHHHHHHHHKNGNKHQTTMNSNTSNSESVEEEKNALLSRAIVETYIKLDEEFLKSMVNANDIVATEHDDNSINSIKLTKSCKASLQENMVGGGCTAVCSIVTPTHVIVG